MVVILVVSAPNFGNVGTRDRHKKVVRCITNVSGAVVHLRRETLRESMFLPMLCN